MRSDTKARGPSASLSGRLTRLGVAERQWQRAGRRHLRQIARDLPLFDTAWIDACLRDRLITPYQADCLDGGGTADLFIGPFTVRSRVDTDAGRRVLLASHGSGRAFELLELPVEAAAEDAALRKEIEAAAVLAPQASSGSLQWVRGVVAGDNGQPWAVLPAVTGQSLRDRVTTGGRMLPQEVAAIASGMLTALRDVADLGRTHGDIRAGTVRLDERGRIVLVRCPLGGILRPVPSFDPAARPELSDGTAPERIGTNAPHTPRSDLYAAGCLLWELLAGRPPFPHGSALGKLRMHVDERVPAVTDFAPDTPQRLAALIETLTDPDPQGRPESAEGAVRFVNDAARPVRLTGSRARRRPRGPVRRAAGRVALATTAAAAAFAAGPTVLDLVTGQTAPTVQTAEASTSDTPSLPQWPEADANGVLQLPSGPLRPQRVISDRPVVVRGQPDGTTTLVVDGSWELFADAVTLENLTVRISGEGVRCQSQDLSLRSCRLYGESPAAGAAVHWTPLDPKDATGRRVELRRCVIAGCRSVVAMAGAVRNLELETCLSVDCESLLQIDGDWPRRPGAVVLKGCTIREGRDLIAFNGGGSSRGQQLSVRLDRTVLDLLGGAVLTTSEAEAADAGRRVRFDARDCVASVPLSLIAGSETLPVIDGPLRFAGPADRQAASSVLADAGVPLAADGWPGVRLKPSRVVEVPPERVVR